MSCAKQIFLNLSEHRQEFWRLNVGSSKYNEDELAILNYFFTNTDGNVYFLKNFPDLEVAALFVA